MFSLARLTCFIAVAEELHFGRAADRLHMTQPPLSRQIQQLENELGVQLVDRTSRSVTLTAAGVAFLPDARRIVRLAESAALTVKRVPTGDLGTVVIGFTAASAHAVLPKLLSDVRESLPDVELVLREMVSSIQIDALAGGELDLGLVRPTVTRPGILTRPIHREALVAAIPDGHPLLDIERLSVTHFEDQAVVMYSPVDARYFHELLISTFTVAGVSPRYVQYVTQVHTMLMLVSSGLGCALVPASARTMHTEGVVFRELRSSTEKPVRLGAAWRQDATNPALHRVLEDIASVRQL
ncbi:MAG: LysR substrate-binding domain-containing protein [Rhodococcus sp. (in: high G+C Gram-positive bacteria)]